MADIDVLVLGAGVVGLAVGRAVAQSGRATIIAESQDSFGTETSARNSEVIHAGIYYPHNSLKARFCVAGRKQLKAIQDTAAANGVELELKTGAEAMAMEPELKAQGALWSPETGIVDSHALMLQYLADFEAAGGILAVQSQVGRMRFDAPDWTVALGDESVSASWVINCAGLHASDVAGQVEGIDVSAIPPTRYARGLYARALPSPHFKRLIYPVPVPGGLGIHATIDLAGSVRFGPDVEWIETLDYSADAARLDGFRQAIARYCPKITDAEMTADYTGIRPKISGPHEPAADFRISGPKEMRVPNQIHLFGIESPGLTSSLAIGDYVAGLIED